MLLIDVMESPQEKVICKKEKQMKKGPEIRTESFGTAAIHGTSSATCTAPCLGPILFYVEPLL